jgi:hypothetical protein
LLLIPCPQARARKAKANDGRGQKGKQTKDGTKLRRRSLLAARHGGRPFPKRCRRLVPAAAPRVVCGRSRSVSTRRRTKETHARAHTHTVG